MTNLVFARSSILKTRLLRQTEKHFVLQSRCFTGNFLPWHKTVQLKGIMSKNARLALPTIPYSAFSSATVKSLAKNIAAVKSADEYLDLFENFKDSTGMTQANRITILHHLARFAVSAPGKNFTSTKKALQTQHNVFKSLLVSIAARLDRSKPRDLASIVWSLGKLRKHVAWFVIECEKEILQRDVTSFSTPSVCQLLNGFASLDCKQSQFFTCVEQGILGGKLKMSKFKNLGLAGALWSFTKTGNGSKLLFEKFQQEILLRDVKKFSSAQLVQFLWSFTQKGIQCKKLFEITEQELLQRPMEDLHGDSIKMLLWLFAKADIDKDGNFEFFNSFRAEVIQRGIRDFDSEHLSMLVWSFAKRCPKVDAMFDFVEEELHLRNISHFKNHELSLILRSFAVSGHFSTDLFKLCQEEILSRDLSLFKADELSQLVWAFGISTISSSDFFSRIEKEVLCKVSIFSDNDLCFILHGFSQASAGTRKLFEQLEREVLDRNIPENKPELIPELALAFSKCSSYKALLIFDAMEKVLKVNGPSLYTDHKLQGLSTAFSKVGKELPFAAEYKQKESDTV